MSKQVTYIVMKKDPHAMEPYMGLSIRIPDLGKDYGPCLPDGVARIEFRRLKRNAHRFYKYEVQQMFPGVDIDALQSGDEIPGFRLKLIMA